MASTRALRFVAAGKRTRFGTLFVHCHVKPGASKVREGITAVTEDAVEICVAAPPRDGEANKAVVRVLGEALGLPKSDLQITQGLKSRDKTVAIGGELVKDGEEDCLRRVRGLLGMS